MVIQLGLQICCWRGGKATKTQRKKNAPILICETHITRWTLGTIGKPPKILNPKILNFLFIVTSQGNSKI